MDSKAANVSFWKNRNGVVHHFWTEKEIDSAEGYLITNLDDLPVIEFNFGPEIGAEGLCSTHFQLGKLVCTGKRIHGIKINTQKSDFYNNLYIYSLKDSRISNSDSSGDVARKGSSVHFCTIFKIPLYSYLKLFLKTGKQRIG